ncbi:MAG: peptide-methionine (R)-S-oxide reductase MsrB [Alphaproteobacteria bacterium]|nr:peptide-methionine (R)-S-oxide reductase MsrB [Alphaproteobacteria bacterium]
MGFFATPNLYAAEASAANQHAIFGGGCFWCVEHAFKDMDGVLNVVSGYGGGHTDNPTYNDVASRTTGHAELVNITFDPAKVSYEKLVRFFLTDAHDPTQLNRQGPDVGDEYRSIILYTSAAQKNTAESVIAELTKAKYFPKPIVTQVVPLEKFYMAEEHHQDYFDKYKEQTGREHPNALYDEKRLKERAVKSREYNSKREKQDLSHLDDMQIKVTQHGGTEPAFRNKYWNHKEEGIYVDVVTGEALFSSKDKYDSGTGWPSFTKPIEKQNVDFSTDNKFGMSRTEVKSSGGSHLGHVFPDGPKDKGGERFCINSAALTFIPVDKMKEKGYTEYLYLFEDNNKEKAKN